MTARPDGDPASPSGLSSALPARTGDVPSLLPGHGPAVLPADALLLGFFLILILQHRRRVRRKRKAWKILCQLVALHQNTLAQRQQTCLTRDHYGLVHKERWEKELAYFCQSVLLAALRQQELASFWPVLEKRTLRRIRRVIRIIIKRNGEKPAQMEEVQPTDTSPEQFSTGMDPLDYERFCARLLRRAGWRAEPTPPGSDQGVDILASRDGVHLVLQCKLYTRPVGNKAVQEIFTARQHRRAHYAAVVSNAGYTRPARQLAHGTGVQLLHHSQLSTLDLSDLKPDADLFNT